jgi:hypothetical protein
VYAESAHLRLAEARDASAQDVSIATEKIATRCCLQGLTGR